MKIKIIIAILALALVFGLGACNLPSNSSPDSFPMEAQAGTLAAQTVSAVLTEIPTETRVPANTPTMAPPTETHTPLVSPTPTEAPSPLNPPSLKEYNFFCSWNGSNTEMKIDIQWTDRSTNEMGFIILRDGVEIANLLPNVTAYTDILAVSTGQKVNYAIFAYNNESGQSGSFNLSATCE